MPKEQTQTSWSDRLLGFQFDVLRPLLKKRGIDLVETHSREERIKFLSTQIALMSIEGGGLKEIKAALGGKDGDLDELSAALHQTEEIRNAQPFKIKINRLPEGSAPDEHKKHWRGCEMMAISANNSQGEFDPLGVLPSSERGPVYIVSSRQAFNALEEHSPKAAKYFRENFKDTPFLSFKVSEAEIVA